MSLTPNFALIPIAIKFVALSMLTNRIIAKIPKKKERERENQSVHWSAINQSRKVRKAIIDQLALNLPFSTKIDHTFQSPICFFSFNQFIRILVYLPYTTHFNGIQRIYLQVKFYLQAFHFHFIHIPLRRKILILFSGYSGHQNKYSQICQKQLVNWSDTKKFF